MAVARLPREFRISPENVRAVGPAGSAHNSVPDEIHLASSRKVVCAHTWPDHLSDQKGLMVTVEQGHCTLAAVKRYWDTLCWRTA